MRSITKGEAAVIRALLAAAPVSERKRMAETGLQSRTFERIRKRAYASGWVFDRFIPNPSQNGFETVYFVLAQPFAEDLEEIVTHWKDLSSNVLLWRWPQTIFGVFFSGESRARFSSRLLPAEARGEAFIVASPTDGSYTPVYFDFEAVWARLTDQLGTAAYPHPLPYMKVQKEGARRRGSMTSETIAGLVARPFQPTAENSPLRTSPFFFPRSYQHLLETGTVERRTILDLQNAPPFEGHSVERVAFLKARLNSTGTEEDLFRMLMALQVMPFLIASDRSRILLASLSRAPMDTLSPSRRVSILGSLSRILQDIQIVREPVRDLSVVVNHRYDRLFARIKGVDQPAPAR